jgi:hypothetical protein
LNIQICTHNINPPDILWWLTVRTCKSGLILCLCDCGSRVDSASIRNEYQAYFLWRGRGGRRLMRRADNLTTFMCQLPWNLAASYSWNPQHLSRPVQGLLYPLYVFVCASCWSHKINYNRVVWSEQC